MDCDPPRGIGQPTACPAIPSTSAKAEDAGDSNGRKECAAIPANKARADSLLNRTFVNSVAGHMAGIPKRSEEHTSELQSLAYLVCRLLLEKKKKNTTKIYHHTPIHDRTNAIR